jgi:hypothetical protein
MISGARNAPKGFQRRTLAGIARVKDRAPILGKFKNCSRYRYLMCILYFNAAPFVRFRFYCTIGAFIVVELFFCRSLGRNLSLLY